MKQTILILIVIVLAATGAYWLTTHKPEIKKHTKKPNIPAVQVTTINQQNYTTTVYSSGVVEARTQTNLVAEVAGKITLIGKAFQEGNYLQKNNLLLKISDTDYLNNISIAKAEIAQSQLALQEQIAQRNLAKQDWDLFGEKRRKPSELAMRTPHIASAKAALQAAKTRINQANTQLARTKILAPYNGRVLSRNVDIGQYVTPGTVLGKIFATDYIEVRLPLSLKDYELLNIPEHYQNADKPRLENLPSVIFYTHKQEKDKHQWQGQIVRTSAALDSNTRQLSVIARINKPFEKRSSNRSLVKLGQFLQAEIIGKQLSNVFVIPNTAIHNRENIYLFSPTNDSHTQNTDNTKDPSPPVKNNKADKETKTITGILKIKPVHILHTDDENTVISSEGLSNGNQIIITSPPIVTNHMKVKIVNSGEKQ